MSNDNPITRAQKIVQGYNQQFARNAEKAAVSIAGYPYMILPPTIFKEVTDVTGEDVADMLFYRMGYELGVNEAERIFSSMDVPRDLVLRIAIGPMHFMTAGLGPVNLLELKPGEFGDDNTVLVAEHPEAQTRGLEVGFAAGWLSASTESSMAARSVPHDGSGLRLVIAHQDKIFELSEDPHYQQPRSTFEVAEARPLNP